MALRAAGRTVALLSEERVVLVDADDREVGTEEKLRAHRSGLLHRAISVFLFDGRGRTLLQRRAEGKYHSAGKWSNTCCSHPRPGELAVAAAERRLLEEMGIRCALSPAFSFEYRADLGNGLVEHELDHVFVGRFDGNPHPDPSEVQAWDWVELPKLRADCAADPDRYTAWLPLALLQLKGL